MAKETTDELRAENDSDRDKEMKLLSARTQADAAFILGIADMTIWYLGHCIRPGVTEEEQVTLEVIRERTKRITEAMQARAKAMIAEAKS